MTTFSDLKTRELGRYHDLKNGDPDSATLPGPEVCARNVVRKYVDVVVEADAAAGTTISERAEIGFPATLFPGGVEVKEILLRSAAITPHADNHATDTFACRDANGANATTAATITTDADVAIGSGGLGGSASTAMKSYEALLNATVANRRVPVGGCLTLARAKGGTGVQLGRVHYTVVVEAL